MLNKAWIRGWKFY